MSMKSKLSVAILSSLFTALAPMAASAQTGTQHDVTSDRAVSPAEPPTTVVGGQDAPTTSTQSDNGQGKSAKKPKVSTLATVNVISSATSHIDFANIVSPTPVVSFTPAQLQLHTEANVGNALYALPQVVADRGPQATGTNTDASGSPIDLRGLGVNRTLVLVDGHRLVGNNDGGGNDLNAIPSILIKDVQVVTGGASAAWGSGAVAGVVAVNMDHDFNGAVFDMNYGQSSHSDDKTRMFRFAIGGDFSGGRGHAEIGGDFTRSSGVLASSRPNVNRWQILPLVDDPTKTANFTNVGMSNQTWGGLILSGALKGMTFGQGGTLSPNVVDRVAGAAAIGTPQNAPGASDFAYQIDPLQHYTVMGAVDYALSDNVKASVTLDHYETKQSYAWFSLGLPTLTIARDNAYLPQDVVSAMTAAGEDSFQFGRFDQDINYPRLINDSRTTQVTVKVDGSTSNFWHWSLFYTHGQNQLNQDAPGFPLTQHLLDAADAVVNPASGQIVCRVTLTNPNSGCVPINLFGPGSPSVEAAQYVTGTASERVTRTLDQAGFNISGQPFKLPAGPVSIAAGIGGWRQAVNQRVGALDQEQALSWFFYNPMRGSQSVVNGYVEANVPLITDAPGLHDLAMDVAVRKSHYDTSGGVNTWKVGFTDRVVGQLRARVALSHDERAPDLGEMFTTGTQGFDTLFDPLLNTSYNVLIESGGNPHLKPEAARTFTGGLTWAGPGGVALSADYFNIKIDQIITTIDPQLIVSLCSQGSSSMCSLITRGGSGNMIQVLNDDFINLSTFKEDGVDLEASKAWSGSLFGANGHYNVRLLGTWVHKLTEDNGASTLNFVGSQGQAFVNLGVPRWRGVLTAGFSNNQFDVHARVRYLSAGYYDTTQSTLVNNRIAQYFYADVGGSYTVQGTKLTFYGELRNLANKRPPIASEYGAYYDVIGRFFQLGAKVKF